MSVGAFGLIGGRNVVECKVREAVGPAVDLVDLGLLAETAVESPDTRFGLRRRRHCFLDNAVGGVEITLEQMAGGDERLADVVEVIGRAIGGKAGGRIEH